MSAVHRKCEKGENKNEKEEEICESKRCHIPIRVDYFPSQKERNKAISQCSVYIFKYIHAMDLERFNQYATRLKLRRHHIIEYRVLVEISKADISLNSGNPHQGLDILDSLDRSLNISHLPQELMVRYLTSRSMLEKMIGGDDNCSDMQERAVQIATQMPASNATALSFTMYALHTVLHDRRIIENICSHALNDQRWMQAENYCRRACEHHQEWVKDLDGDYHIQENVIQGFFLLAFVRYTAVLLRSCLGRGFVYFDQLSFPKENLVEVLSCFERIKSQDYLLSRRARLEFCLVQCDYHLRCCNMENEKTNISVQHLEKANIFAEKARKLINTYKEKKTARYLISFPKLRLAYIRNKLAEFVDPPLSVINTGDHDIIYSYKDLIGLDNKQCGTSQHDIQCPYENLYSTELRDSVQHIDVGQTDPKQPVSILQELSLVSTDVGPSTVRHINSVNCSYDARNSFLQEPDTRSTYAKDIATCNDSQNTTAPVVDLRLDDSQQTLSKSVECLYSYHVN